MENWDILSRIESKYYKVKSVGMCNKCKSRTEKTCIKKFCTNWILERILNV